MQRARVVNASPGRPVRQANPKASLRSTTSAGDGTSVTRRLQQELMTLMMNEDKSISAFPEGDNIMKWKGTIKAPEETVFSGMEFKLSLEFPASYPFNAPTVKFESSCFHPNISENGDICLDILKDQWSALYDARTILLSIQSLLGEPNNNSPLNPLAAKMWSDPEQYRKHALRFYNNQKS